MAGKIIIDVYDSGEQNIDIQNISVSYLPYLCGRVLKKAIEDPLITGTKDDIDITVLKKTALNIVSKELGVSQKPQWISLKDKQPEEEGFYLCYEEKTGKVFVNMLWDKDAQVFGNQDGIGYGFVTHWYPYPELLERKI